MAFACRIDHLCGQILIAAPTMLDSRFERSVIYLCAHSEDGAMGIVINQTAKHVDFSSLLTKLDVLPCESTIQLSEHIRYSAVHLGGPCEPGRGFVLHSSDYQDEGATISVDSDVHLTSTPDILRRIVLGSGPKQYLFALGYAGWAPGQLEREIHANSWLYCPADPSIVFSAKPDRMYNMALASIGVTPLHFVSEIGHS